MTEKTYLMKFNSPPFGLNTETSRISLNMVIISYQSLDGIYVGMENRTKLGKK